MPRPRSPKRDLALRLWLESKKKKPLDEIAAELDVSLSQIRKWKCIDHWDKAKLLINNGERVVKIPKPRGAPKGSKNAKGHGAPKGNTNAVKTGEFQTILFENLQPKERELVDLVTLDAKAQLQKEIQILTLREKRMLDRLESLRDREDVTADISTKITYSSKIEQTVKVKSGLSEVQRVEEALTRVQGQLHRDLELLHKIDKDDWEMF